MPPTDIIEKEASTKDRELKHALGTWDISFLVIGAMIGSGWLFGALGGAYTAGPAAIISWVIAAVLMLFVALVYAELAGMLPKSGGIVRYPQYTYGGLASYIFSWSYLLSSVSVSPSESLAAITYMSSYVNGLFTSSGVLSLKGFAVALVLMLFFFALNWYGVKVMSSVNTAVGVWKVAIPTVTLALLFALDFHASYVTSLRGGFAPYGWAAVFMAIPTQGIAYSYLGFRQGVDFAGEAKKPSDVIKGTVLGFILVALIYVLLQVSFIGAVNWSAVSVTPGDWQGLFSALHSGPFYLIMKQSGLYILAGFAVLLLIDAVVSPAGTAWIYVGTCARTMYGMAATGNLPSTFLALNSHKVPLWGTILTFLIGLLFFLPFPTWYAISSFIVLTTVLTYVVGGPALVTLRRTAADAKRPIKLPWAEVMGAIAMIASFLIVYWATYYVLWFAFVLIMGGLPLFFGYSAVRAYGSSLKRGITAALLYLATLVASTYYLIYAPIVAPTGWPSSTVAIALTGARLIDFGVYVIVVAFATFLALLYVRPTMDERGKKHVLSGLWVIGVLLSAYVLSFLGDFGVFSVPVIPFPYDTVIAAVTALIWYWAAVQSGIVTEELQIALKELGVP
ncbi:APC family permease [Tardisphaera miroshnichenkoae]